MKAPTVLTKKLGPLPAWAWALVIVGGYFAAKKLRGAGSGASTSTDTTAQDTSAAPYYGSDVGTNGAVSSGTGAGASIDNPPVAGGFAADPQTVLASNGDMFGALFDSLNTSIGALVSRPVIDPNDTLITTLGELASRPQNITVAAPKANKPKAAPKKAGKKPAARKKQVAHKVAAHGKEKAHWATPDGTWRPGPGSY